jgi:hypothetical protein
MAASDQDNLGFVTAMLSAAKLPPAAALKGWIAAIMLSAVLMSGAAAAPNKGSSQEATTAPKIAAFMTLLADPEVQKWLEKENAAEAAAPPAHVKSDESVSHYFVSRLGAVREQMIALAAALPGLPDAFARGFDRL